MKAKLIKTDKSNYILIDTTKKVYDEGYLLGTSKESLLNRLSLKNCEAIANGYDLDELADENVSDIHEANTDFMFKDIYREFFKEGFQKALELVEHRLSKEAEWQVEIVMDICGDKVYAVHEPALDEQGCLILKKIDN